MRIHIISRYNTHCHKNLHRLGIYFHNDDDELVIIINRNQHDDCKLAQFYYTTKKTDGVIYRVCCPCTVM